MHDFDPNKHPYTLHLTYTGKDCAICGLPSAVHPMNHWVVDGKKINPETGQEIEK